MLMSLIPNLPNQLENLTIYPHQLQLFFKIKHCLDPLRAYMSISMWFWTSSIPQEHGQYETKILCVEQFQHWMVAQHFTSSKSNYTIHE